MEPDRQMQLRMNITRNKRRKLKKIEGGTIEAVVIRETAWGGGHLECLMVSNPDGQRFEVQVWADDEGNAPGTLLIEEW